VSRAGRTDSLRIMSDLPWSELGLDIQRVRDQERTQLQLLKRMTNYAYTKGCRRTYLLQYFGDASQAQRNCQTCDVCTGKALNNAVKTASPRKGHSGPTKLAKATHSVLAVEELKHWRRELAKELGVPAFVILHDKTLLALASALPTNRREFLSVKGAGEARWERFGPHIIRICAAARAAGH